MWSLPFREKKQPFYMDNKTELFQDARAIQSVLDKDSGVDNSSNDLLFLSWLVRFMQQKEKDVQSCEDVPLQRKWARIHALAKLVKKRNALVQNLQDYPCFVRVSKETFYRPSSCVRVDVSAQTLS